MRLNSALSAISLSFLFISGLQAAPTQNTRRSLVARDDKVVKAPKVVTPRVSTTGPATTKSKPSAPAPVTRVATPPTQKRTSSSVPVPVSRVATPPTQKRTSSSVSRIPVPVSKVATPPTQKRTSSSVSRIPVPVSKVATSKGPQRAATIAAVSKKEASPGSRKSPPLTSTTPSRIPVKSKLPASGALKLKSTTAKISSGPSCAYRPGGKQKRSFLYRRGPSSDCEGEASTSGGAGAFTHQIDVGNHAMTPGTVLNLNGEHGAPAKVTVGAHLPGGSTAVGHDVAAHDLPTSKPLVVKKILSGADPAATQTEINNLRHQNKLHATGEVGGLQHLVVDKAPGQSYEKSGISKDQAKQAMGNAQVRMAEQHQQIQADRQTGNANFEVHPQTQQVTAHWYDLANLHPAPAPANPATGYTDAEKAAIRQLPKKSASEPSSSSSSSDDDGTGSYKSSSPVPGESSFGMTTFAAKHERPSSGSDSDPDKPSASKKKKDGQ